MQCSFYRYTHLFCRFLVTILGASYLWSLRTPPPANALVVCLSTVRAGFRHEGAGVLHRIEGHLDGLQYLHVLQNVMVPSVRMFYPEGIIHLQQDHSSIHDSLVVQEWLSWQTSNSLTGYCGRLI
jgi:hypothetical protein